MRSVIVAVKDNCGKENSCHFISLVPLIANLYVQTAFNNIQGKEIDCNSKYVGIGCNSM
jgi:hypothetical protein